MCPVPVQVASPSSHPEHEGCEVSVPPLCSGMDIADIYALIVCLGFVAAFSVMAVKVGGWWVLRGHPLHVRRPKARTSPTTSPVALVKEDPCRQL